MTEPGGPVRQNPFPRLARFALFLCLFPASFSHAQKSTEPATSRRLRNRIASILKSGAATQAHWGIAVIPLSPASGRPLLTWNDDNLFVPASTAKLFTTATALVRLGPDYTYRTTIEATSPPDESGRIRGDLILVGRGDPNLSPRTLPYNTRTERTGSPAKALEELAAQAASRGLRAVDGDLIVDDTYFVFQPYPPGWTVGDLLWWYGAPVYALSINDNILSLTVLPGPHAGDPALVRLEPAQSDFQIVNRVITTAGPQPDGATRRISIDRQPGSRVLTLWGQISQADPGLIESVAMDDPPGLAGILLRQELERLGVKITGTTRVRHQEPFEIPDLRGAPHLAASPSTPPPPSREILASRRSVPLAESLKVINKVSQNLHAEMLLRTLGRERRQVGSAEAGLEEVGAFLKEIGIDETQASLRDGSGLSRQTLVSPAAMAMLLRYMYGSPYRSVWMETLPVAGRDGTLSGRLRQPAVVGRVHAKSGAESGIASLAGYITARNNDTWAFAIFVDNHNLPAAAVTSLMDKVVEEIMKSINGIGAKQASR